MIQRKIESVFIVSLVLLSFSCGMSVYTPEEQGNNTDENSGMETASELFSEDAENKNLFVFETNDTSYLTSKGCTLWTLKNESSEVFKTRTVRLVKESGSANAGFGFVFCVQESDTKGAYNMLTVLLNTNGQYAVGKIIKGNYTNIQWWTDSQFINRGYGAVNYIRVEYDEETTEFTLYANDSQILVFSDADTSPRLCCGGDGYVVVLASDENYPAVSTKVTFLDINGE